MRKAVVVLAITVLSGCASNNKISLEYIKEKQVEEETSMLITDLASDQFMGRKPGTEGYELTSSYVEEYLKKNNIKPFFNNTYRDTVVHNKNVSANIVGLIGTRDNTKPHILIGAHLDHLGKLNSTVDSVYNGANDNASGVTAVLQIAKQLNKFKFDHNIIIALFTEEENGLVGSRHLAKKLKEQNVNLSYMINFEMIGKTLTTGPNQVYITGYDKSNFAEEMNLIVERDFVVFLPAELPYSLFRRSDNYAFYQIFDIPSHTISTFDFENYDHYHEYSDEVKLLDLENMNDVINTSTFAISQLLLNKIELKNTTSDNKED